MTWYAMPLTCLSLLVATPGQDGSGGLGSSTATSRDDVPEAVIALLDAVHANANAASSYYIERELRSYRITGRAGLDAVPKGATPVFVTTLQWWRSGRFWCRRYVSRPLSAAPYRVLAEERLVGEEDSELTVTTAEGGRLPTTVMEYFGDLEGDLFWRGQTVRDPKGLPPGPAATIWLTQRKDVWRTLAQGGTTPGVLLPGGSGRTSPYGAIREAVERREVLWRDGIELLGHRCVVLEARTKERSFHKPEPAAASQRGEGQGLEYRLGHVYRLYLDRCCPGLIRGWEHILESANAGGDVTINENVGRTYEARRVDGRIWVAWVERQRAATYEAGTPEAEREAIVSVATVRRCEFRALREDEPGIEIPAWSRVHDLDQEDAVYLETHSTVLTADNFDAWRRKVRRGLAPAAAVLAGPAPGVVRVNRPARFGGLILIVLGLLLLAPVAALGARWWRQWRAGSGSGATRP